MKLRAIGHLLGFRPAPATYGFEIRRFELPKDGPIEYAQWLHPAETRKVITQQAVEALRTFIRPGDVAIDVGAHSGDTAIPMALAAGPEGCVLALEPNPYVFPILERNASLNPVKTNIRALNFAATRSTGPAVFEYSDAGFCNGGRHEGISKWRHAHAFPLEVKGVNLDGYLRAEAPGLIPKLRFVKVDAEGYDLEVLSSIEALLVETRPYVQAEVFGLSPVPQRQRLMDYLRDLGYELRRLERDHEYRGRPISQKDIVSGDQFDLFAAPEPSPL